MVASLFKTKRKDKSVYSVGKWVHYHKEAVGEDPIICPG